MIALIQRVRSAGVTVDGCSLGRIGPGLLVLVCAVEGDGPENRRKLADKTADLRIFSDENGRMNRSLLQSGGEVLVVSQFTLAADTQRGNRPSFTRAATPETAESLYEAYKARLAQKGLTVASGRFGADMQVDLINDGPVTIWMER